MKPVPLLARFVQPEPRPVRGAWVETCVVVIPLMSAPMPRPVRGAWVET